MWNAVIYLWAINILTLLCFGWDKNLARRRKRRIPERTLLGFAAIGGSPGAWLGRWLFRHKTRKRSFTIRLIGLTAAQIAVLYFAINNGFPALVIS